MEALQLDFTNTHVLITGGAGYIGSSTVTAFLELNAYVTVLDLNPSKLRHVHPKLLPLKADISSEDSVESAFATATTKFGVPTVCIAMAGLDLSVLPHRESLIDMPLEQWRRTFQTNVEGTFLTARAWLKGINAHKDEELRNVSLVIVGSESGTFGDRMNADYASSKSAIQFGLVQSLKGDVARIYPRARVNAIAPGPMDTKQFRLECTENPEQLWLDSGATTALGKPVPTLAVAKSIVFLANETWSGHVTGQILNVDSGKHGKVMWTKEEHAEAFT